MGFGSILRGGLQTIDSLTGGSDGFQSTITMRAWKGFGTYGDGDYDLPVIIAAIVDERQVKRTLPDGEEVMQRALITITRPVTPNGAPNRREPIDPRDKIVLASGYTGPIIEIKGPVDVATGHPFMSEIALG